MRGLASDVIVKIVTLFLVVIAVLAMFGRLKLRLPGRDRLSRGKCPKCGRYQIGKGPCPCRGGRT
ncbi:MAG: hypothetical protein AAGF79_09025 [Pseudomonadota bacterium]